LVQIAPTRGQNTNQNRGDAIDDQTPHIQYAPPPPLGVNIDRCITKHVTQFSFPGHDNQSSSCAKWTFKSKTY
jgi:hypothetical protein